MRCPVQQWKKKTKTYGGQKQIAKVGQKIQQKLEKDHVEGQPITLEETH